MSEHLFDPDRFGCVYTPSDAYSAPMPHPMIVHPLVLEDALVRLEP